jgi:hypothetical protein
MSRELAAKRTSASDWRGDCLGLVSRLVPDDKVRNEGCTMARVFATTSRTAMRLGGAAFLRADDDRRSIADEVENFCTVAVTLGRRSVDRQVRTLDRCCTASDLGNSVDTVVVGWHTASLPAIAVSAGEAGSPRPPRHEAYPFGEYSSNDVECAHRCPPWTCTGVVFGILGALPSAALIKIKIE